MIVHLRIDNRLIHGQVAVTWMAHIGSKEIIVCNDKVAADPIQQMALPMAAPGKKVLVLSVADTIAYAAEHQDDTLFVICKFPADALAVMKSGVGVKTVNVGNAAPIAGTKYVMVDKSIAATAEDAAVYREIAELNGGKLTSQLIPTLDSRDFLSMLKSAGL